MGVGREAAVEGEEADGGTVAAEEVEALEDGVGRRLAADAGIGTQQEAAVGVLGEGGGEADQGPMAGAGPVFLQGLVVDPMRQGGEVEVGGVGDEAALGPQAGQSPQQALVHGAGDAVGVGGHPGRPGQDVEAGEQAGAAVHAPQVVVGVALDAGALEGDEGEHGLQRGQGGRAGVAGGLDGLVDAEVAQEGQQAQDAGGGLALERLVAVGVQQDGGGRFQGSGTEALPLGAGAPGQAGEPLLLENAVDGALGRGLVGGGVEASLDVGDGEVALAPGDDLAPDFAGGGEGRATAPGRGPEKVGGRVGEAAEVAGEGVDGGGGVAELAGDLGGGAAFEEEGAQEFVMALTRMDRLGEEVGRAGHGRDLN